MSIHRATLRTHRIIRTVASLVIIASIFAAWRFVNFSVLFDTVNAGSAFSNLAGRILGEDIKILDFLPQKNRRIILNNECSSGNRI